MLARTSQTFSRSYVEQTVQGLVKQELFILGDDDILHKSLITELNADSFDLLMIRDALEDEFSLTFDDKAYDEVVSVRGLVNLVFRTLSVSCQDTSCCCHGEEIRGYC